MKKNKEDILLFALYVDDLIFMGNNDQLIAEFRSIMTREFEMTNLGLMRYYLGIEV